MKSFLLTTFAACTSAWFAPSSSRSGDMARRLGPRRAIDQADREAMQAAIALVCDASKETSYVVIDSSKYISNSSRKTSNNVSCY